jgi:hypothetical protein
MSQHRKYVQYVVDNYLVRKLAVFCFTDRSAISPNADIAATCEKLNVSHKVSCCFDCLNHRMDS